jgi:DNA-binding NtrC family response regulator
MLISHVPNALDGLDVARVLHGIAPRCPVLLVIVSTNGVSVDALAQAGIVEVLPRPVDNAELAIILKRCLRSTGAISDS